MKLFLNMLSINLKLSFQLRWSFLFSIIICPIIFVFNIYLSKAIFQFDSSKIILGYSLNQMIWYFAASSFIYILIWSPPDQDISKNIISGQLNYLLLQPVSVLRWELAMSVAGRIAGIMFEFIPIVLIYMLMAFPDFLTPAALIKYFFLNIFAFMLFFWFNVIIGISAFIIKSVDAMQKVKMIVVSFGAGAFIPLDFFPPAIQGIMKMLPFQYLLYVPIQFLLNKPETRNWNYFFSIILIQLLWTGVFFLISTVGWRRMVKRYCAFGG